MSVLVPLLLAAGCTTSGLPDFSALAARPPLPYSVVISGGSFVRPQEGSEPGARTFIAADGSGAGEEAIPLARFVEILRAGNVFVSTERDFAEAPVRHRIAPPGPGVPARSAELDELLEQAREAGHDLLVIVEGLQDGPIEFQGVNGQWPITLAVWLVLALGVVVPDHTYESRAQLRISVRELQSGRAVYSTVLGAGPLDLPLIERSDLVGFLISVIVPPFLIGDDAEVARASIAAYSARRLVESAARQLKSLDASESIRAASAAVFSLRPGNGTEELVVDAAEDLSVVRLRLDGRALDDEAMHAFERTLLQSAARSGTRLRYVAPLPAGLRGDRLQVLVQTVAGRRASSTFLVGEEVR